MGDKVMTSSDLKHSTHRQNQNSNLIEYDDSLFQVIDHIEYEQSAKQNKQRRENNIDDYDISTIKKQKRAMNDSSFISASRTIDFDHRSTFCEPDVKNQIPTVSAAEVNTPDMVA